MACCALSGGPKSTFAIFCIFWRLQRNIEYAFICGNQFLKTEPVQQGDLNRMRVQVFSIPLTVFLRTDNNIQHGIFSNDFSTYKVSCVYILLFMISCVYFSRLGGAPAPSYLATVGDCWGATPPHPLGALIVQHRNGAGT